MSIFRRVNDIITANLNELVDRFEDPQKMLRQAVREMDDAIAATTVAAARSIAGQKLLDKEIESQHAEATSWHKRAAAAVAARNDAAARRALVRRREHQRLIDALESERSAVARATARLRHYRDDMKVKRAEAGRILLVLAARQSAADSCGMLHTHGTAIPVSAAFDRVARLRQHVEFAQA